MADANNTTSLPSKAGQELGQSGTYVFYGFISGEEYNIDLVGKAGLQVMDIMRRSDATVHATLIVCKNPIIGADWDIEPASSDPIDVEIADFVRRELFGRAIQWQDTLREALTALDFGHSVMEKVYEITEFNGKTRIGLAKIASRKQRSIFKWCIGVDGNKPGVTQILPSGSLVEIPRRKLVIVTNEREGDNYEGISLLRFAYKPWKIKDALELMNAIALERMAVGIPMVTKGENAQTTDESELIKVRAALRQLRANEEGYIEVPDSLKIEMMDMKAGTTKDVLPTIEHQNRQIMLSVLAQFVMLGQQSGSGSRAVSADHSTLFMKSLEAVARTVQLPFQVDVVQDLVDLNYSNLKNGYPKLIFSDLSDDDAAAQATGVSSLVTAGAITPDADVENRLRTSNGLPEMSEEAYNSYEERHKPPEIDPANPDDPNAKDANTPNDDPTKVKKAQDDKVPVDDKTKKTKAAVIADAKLAQQALIAKIFED